ncbi:MAG: hypothetical protein ACM34H_00555 [Deltaproteobacteria bacterium]
MGTSVSKRVYFVNESSGKGYRQFNGTKIIIDLQPAIGGLYVAQAGPKVNLLNP